MSRVTATALLATTLVCSAATAQLPQSTAPPEPASNSPSARTVRLRKGTLLKLQTLEALDPSTARAGDQVPLRFQRALSVEGITLIPAGTLVQGTVAKVTPANKHCPAGEIVWHLSSITLPDSTFVRTHVRYKTSSGDLYVPESMNEPVNDRIGRGIETTLALPILAPLFPIEGIKSLVRKPTHGCAAYSPNKPMRARSSVAVEVREDHDVRY